MVVLFTNNSSSSRQYHHHGRRRDSYNEYNVDDTDSNDEELIDVADSAVQSSSSSLPSPLKSKRTLTYEDNHNWQQVPPVLTPTGPNTPTRTTAVAAAAALASSLLLPPQSAVHNTTKTTPTRPTKRRATKSVTFAPTKQVYSIPSRRQLSKEEKCNYYITYEELERIKTDVRTWVLQFHQGQLTNDQMEDGIRGLERCCTTPSAYHETKARKHHAMMIVLTTQQQQIHYEQKLRSRSRLEHFQNTKSNSNDNKNDDDENCTPVNATTRTGVVDPEWIAVQYRHATMESKHLAHTRGLIDQHVVFELLGRDATRNDRTMVTAATANATTTPTFFDYEDDDDEDDSNGDSSSPPSTASTTLHVPPYNLVMIR